MSGLFSYSLRFAQYVDLMVLFGLPLFAWYDSGSSIGRGEQRFSLSRGFLTRGLLACSLVGLVLVSIVVARTTAAIMGVMPSELAREDLTWYLFDTAAGRADLARAFFLVLLSVILGWQLWRNKHRFPVKRVTLLAGMVLASLAWKGHAASGEGVSGAMRLLAGIAHLLAAGGWIGAIAAILIQLVHCGRAPGGERLEMLWWALHTFSRPGTIFVGVLLLTGIFHYGDLVDWSVGLLFHSPHGNLLLIKLALFAGMVGLAAIHRWYLVPWLERDIRSGAPSHSARRLLQSVTIEAIFALLILMAVAVFGTLNPHG